MTARNTVKAPPKSTKARSEGPDRELARSGNALQTYEPGKALPELRTARDRPRRD